MSEAFRNIRTNLQFMLDNDQKVILVTSTVSGEGKSFVSANLAISLSLLGKKVVIVGLDIRKPGLNKVFQLSNKERGITQYLSNPETDLMELVQPSDVNKNLFIPHPFSLDTYIHYTDFYIAENRTAHWSGWLQISFHSACTVSV